MDLPDLTEELATEIAAETSAIIGYNVLITDRQGLIIGSGDPSRTGGQHPVSAEVVETGRAVSRRRSEIPHADVRPGTTLPITIDGAVVGTVGIAGPVNVVRKLGKLVQRQTEILLRESLSQRTRVLREHAIADLVRDIAVFDERLLDERVILDRAHQLGCDLRGPHTVGLIETAHEHRTNALHRDQLRTLFPSPADVVAELAPGYYAVLHDSTSGDGTVTDDFRTAETAVLERYGLHLRIGVGNIAATMTELARSYADAAAALRLSRQLETTTGVIPISTMRLPQLLESMPAATRTRYVESQIGPLRDSPDFNELATTITTWVHSGLSLIATARALNIHRNTVIYRLDKLAKLLGRDLKDPQQAIPTHLAVLTERIVPERPQTT